MHSHDSIIFAAWMHLFSDFIFKPATKMLPHPEGPLPETLYSTTIKAANEALNGAVLEAGYILQIYMIIWFR